MGARPELDELRASLGARSEGPYHAVTRRCRRDGGSYDVEVRIVEILDDLGNATHYALSHREIRNAGEHADSWRRSSSSKTLAAAAAVSASTAIDEVVTGLRATCAELSSLSELRDAASVESVADALAAAEQARDVVRELASLAEEDTPRLVDVRAALEVAVRMTHGIVGGCARLHRRYEAVPAVHASAAALARTFAQLIQNAAAAIRPLMPAANSISLRTYVDEGGNVVVEVADTGIGIAQDALGHVFDAFFTTKPSSGDGLGLTIARADVLAAGGSLTVESVEGRGSRFSVRLPAAARVEPREALLSSELPSRRVLVACNDPIAARRLRVLFEDQRTIVLDADVDDAVDRLSRGEACDLVVADASDALGASLRERLAEAAPHALMRMFEIATPPRAREAPVRQSGARLCAVVDASARRGVR